MSFWTLLTLNIKGGGGGILGELYTFTQYTYLFIYLLLNILIYLFVSYTFKYW